MAQYRIVGWVETGIDDVFETFYEDIIDLRSAQEIVHDTNIQEPGVYASLQILCEHHGWSRALDGECTECLEEALDLDIDNYEDDERRA